MMTLVGMWLVLAICGLFAGTLIHRAAERLPRSEAITAAWRGVFWQTSGPITTLWPWWQPREWPLVSSFNRWKQTGSFWPPRQLVVEIANACLWVGWAILLIPSDLPFDWNARVLSSPLAFRFPAGTSEATIGFHLWAAYAFFLVLIEALLLATLIDFDLQIIPDSVTVPAMVVGFIGQTALMTCYLLPIWFQDPILVDGLSFLFPEGAELWLSREPVPRWIAQWPMWHGLAVAIAGFLVGGGVVWFVRIVGHWVLGREAMGFGDVILMAMIGCFVGWQPVLIVFFAAPLAALLVVAVTWLVRAQREIPYGPYLALATIGVLFMWPVVFAATERVFSLGPVFVLITLSLAPMLVLSLILVKFVKRLLGLDDNLMTGEWTSADQLQFFATKDHDNGVGPMQRPTWPGVHSGRGLTQQKQWSRR
jgi:leader peptidase (prepilin peptidase) / N-methyltransferase